MLQETARPCKWHREAPAAEQMNHVFVPQRTGLNGKGRLELKPFQIDGEKDGESSSLESKTILLPLQHTHSHTLTFSMFLTLTGFQSSQLLDSPILLKSNKTTNDKTQLLIYQLQNFIPHFS